MTYYSSIYGLIFGSGMRTARRASFSNLKSVLFDGVDDFATLGEPADITKSLASNEMTIAAWIKSTDPTILTAIVSKAQPGVPNISYILGTNTDGSIYGYFGGLENTSSPASVISDGNWHLVGWNVSNTGGGMKGQLWVDGVYKTAGFDANVTGTNTCVGVPVLIGASASGAVRRFKGYIDEVTFWNVGFRASDWTSLYNSGHPLNPNTHSKSANLLHWFRMGDNDTYPVLLDNKGSVSATMTNMATTAITTSVP